MNSSLQTISVAGLAWAFVPVAAVLAILARWTRVAGTATYAVARMLLQLVLIGFALGWIFAVDRPLVVLGILAVMVCAASWIAIRPLSEKTTALYVHTLGAILAGGGLTLALVIFLVVEPDPWYAPRYTIPLAGMIFASCMNTVSLAAERFDREAAGGMTTTAARAGALQAALIPLINSLFAVGLVTLPGMMTGQILSGVSPLTAARYQIVVMCMLFGASGLSAALFLTLAGRQLADAPPSVRR